MKEWVSRLEQIQKAEELKFPDTAGFKPFQHYFCRDSVAHPAKANLFLLYFLIKKFTKPKETVLDPMSGTSSTGIIASLLDRNAVCVDLENKFVEMSKKNAELLEKRGRKKGEITVLKGDSRRLSSLLKQADAVVTSPPYSESISKHAGGKCSLKNVGISTKTARAYTELDETIERLRQHGRTDDKAGGPYGRSLAHPYSPKTENIGNLKHGNVDAVITSPPYSEGIGHDSGDKASEEFKERLKMQKRYTRQMVSEKNIAQLKHGNVDAVITSPPYAESLANENPQRKEGYWKTSGGYQTGHGTGIYGKNERNIGNLPHGSVDAIVTSPPYAEEASPSRAGGILTHKQGCQCNWCKKNRGNAGEIQGYRQVDAVITSPPYSESHVGDNQRYLSGQLSEEENKQIARSLESPNRYGYSKNTHNIGNLAHGNVDAVITSPPYAKTDPTTFTNRHIGNREEPRSEYVKSEGYSKDKENIGNLPHGNVDAVITSPPYADQEVGKGIRKKRWEKIKDREGFKGRKEWKTGTPSHYSESEENIGNLKYDAVITSPPYADTKKGGEADDEKMAERWDKTAKERNWNTWGKTWKTEGRKRALKSLGSGYSKDEENIGNLPFDAVITSPPYEASVSDDKEGPLTGGNERKYGRWKKSTAQKHSYTQRDEPCKVDAVITSPPYESSLEGSTRHTKGGIASRDPALAQTGTYATRLSFGVPVGYSPKRNNIGNLKSTDEEYASLVDAVITSPPYAHESSAAKPTKLEKQGLFKMGHSSEEAYTDEDYRQWDKHKGGNIGKRKLFIRIPCGKEEAQFHDTRKGRKGTIWEYTREVEATPEIIEQVQQLKSEKKGKSETYLEAMLKCYQEMYKVLKPNGKAIIIIKPFIRNKKVVDLPYHTWLLLEKVGFNLVKLFKLRLQQESFWRILYSKKFPKVPKIAHEWILVTQKPSTVMGE